MVSGLSIEHYYKGKRSWRWVSRLTRVLTSSTREKFKPLKRRRRRLLLTLKEEGPSLEHSTTWLDLVSYSIWKQTKRALRSWWLVIFFWLKTYWGRHPLIWRRPAFPSRLLTISLRFSTLQEMLNSFLRPFWCIIWKPTYVSSKMTVRRLHLSKTSHSCLPM